jgi:hypothetical protein
MFKAAVISTILASTCAFNVAPISRSSAALRMSAEGLVGSLPPGKIFH